MARKKGTQVKATLARLRSRFCIIDGEAVACDETGVASFNRVRYRTMTKAFSYTPST